MIVGNIDTKDISVVVQGAIDKEYTPLCLESIRKYLPDSEIILSTWEGSNVNGLDYDILILNEDPGTSMHNNKLGLFNNTNRQLLSTQNGIKIVKNKYILKLRTDALLINNTFLKYFYKFNNSNKKYKLLENRIIVPSIYSREYSSETKLNMVFHISDIYFFGLCEDIKDYFLDTKLLPDSNLSEYYSKYQNIIMYYDNSWSYSPEQYFCFSWIKLIFQV